MTNAFGYVRCAPSAPEAMTDSIANQIEDIYKSAAGRNLQLDRVFIDIVRGDGQQNQLEDLMARVRGEGSCNIIVSDLSRLTRSSSRSIGIRRDLAAHGAILVEANA